MSSDAQDIAVARYLKQEGLVTPEQLQQALQVQAKAVETGKPLSLAAALLQVGAITSGQKEVLEKRLKGEERRSGAQQLSHYRLTKKLGEGGMGAVYLAEDLRNQKKVAVKVLPRKHAADPEFLKRFRREAEAACKLDHPNIVRACEAGEDAGFHFYVMEYCEGEPLDRVLKRTGLLSWRRSFEIARGVARGLGYAHGQGFIHRDIKPANIFLTMDGIPRILDLGLTKKIDESQLSFQTMSGAVLGTPHYLSPEQARSDKSIDGRSDIYSLGATLYHLLTGEPPFSGTTLYEILTKHMTAELPNPQDVAEDIPDGVVHVLRKMMAKFAGDRYADCNVLLKDLERVLDGMEPESAALAAGASAVAQLRKRIEGARRKRAGTYRVSAATLPRKPSARLLYGGIGAMAAVVAILAVARRPTEIDPPPPVVEMKPRPSSPHRSDPEEAAKARLDDLLRTLNASPPAEKSNRIAILQRFVAEHPGTFAAATARGMLNELRVPPASAGARPVDDDWIGEVRKAPPEEQLRRVVEKLKELNPGYDGTHDPTIKEGVVAQLVLASAALTDLSPLRALGSLRRLDVSAPQGAVGRLTDLGPLAELSLIELMFSRTSVSDLSPLARLPLQRISFGAAPVADLGPLRSMPLRMLEAPFTRVCDVSPLEGRPLERLRLHNAPVEDFTAIRKLPLVELWLDFRQDRDAAVLKSIPTLQKINDLPVAEFWKAQGAGAPALPPPGAGSRELRRFTGHTAYVPSAVFSPDGRLVLSTDTDKTVRLWEVDSGREFLLMRAGRIHVVAFLPDGRRMFGGSYKELIEWDAQSGAERRRFPGHTNNLEALAVSPDGRWLASGCNDGIARLFDLSAPSPPALALQAQLGDLNAVAFSPDGRRLLTGGSDPVIRLWDVASRKELGRLEGHRSNVQALAFTPDGGKAVSGGSDECLIVWDLERRVLLRRWVAHAKSVRALAVPWDGGVVLSGGEDGSVRLWDLGTATEVLRLDGHAGRIGSVAFSPDGRRALSSSTDSTVRVWALPGREACPDRKPDPSASLQSLSQGLVGWWKLDDGRGTTAADSSGNGNHGVLKNGPAWTSGKLQGAIEFVPAKDMYVEFPIGSALERLHEGDFTLAAWVKPRTLPPRHPTNNKFGLAVRPGHHEGLYYMLHLETGEARFGFDHWLSGSAKVISASSRTHAFPPGIFHHVAGVVGRAAGAVRLFVDGVLMGEERMSPDAAAAEFQRSAAWRIGIGDPGGGKSGGYAWRADAIIDDVRIYNRALLAGEIAALAGH